MEPIPFKWTYALAATPEALWPLVSDTNRMNLLANMDPVTYDEVPDPRGGTKRIAHQKMLGLPVSWDEHPFEWSYPTGFSVLREFHTGLIERYRATIDLAYAGTGTRITFALDVLPRVAASTAFITSELAKLEAPWGRAYAAVDAYLAGKGPYPFEAMSPPHRTLAATPFTAGADDPKLAQQVFDHVLSEHAHELTHMRPLLLADRWGAGREALLGSFAAMMRRGLVKPQWSLICPHCRGAKGTVPALEDLPTTVRCQACNLDVGRTADDVVELSFRPDPRYRDSEPSLYCVGGPGTTPHVIFQAKLMSGAGRDVGVTVPEGGYRLRGPRFEGHFDFYYAHAEEPAEVDPAQLPVIEIRPTGPVGAPGLRVAGPKLRLRAINDTDWPQDFLIETRSWRSDVLTLAWLKQHPALLEAFMQPWSASPA